MIALAQRAAARHHATFDAQHAKCLPAGQPQAAQSQARSASVQRRTNETQVDVSINLDGTGVCSAETPVPFLNHMLDVSTSSCLLP